MRAHHRRVTQAGFGLSAGSSTSPVCRWMVRDFHAEQAVCKPLSGGWSAVSTLNCRFHLRRLAPMLVGNVVLPYLIYLVLGTLGLSTMTALTASAIPIAIAIGTSMLTGNARFMIAKDGLFPL